MYLVEFLYNHLARLYRGSYMVGLARRVVLKVDSIPAVKCAFQDQLLKTDVDGATGGLKIESLEIQRIMEQDA